MDTTFSDIVQKVMAAYPLQVMKIYLLSYKGKKAVWSVKTDQGEVIVKKVPFAEDHIAFMIHAIDTLRANGIHTPRVCRTVNGNGWVTVDQEHFVVFESVHGRSPEYEVVEELRMILRGMAAFHRASTGIESPTGKFPSFLLLEWETDKAKRAERLAAWKLEVQQKDDKNEFDRLFLQHVDAFLKSCKESMAMLRDTNFAEWVERTKVTKTLCHQDYAAGNLAIGNDGNLYVYDMDSLTVDVPIRDMRKILNKVMKKETAWDVERMLIMMKAYQEVNPLTKDQYRALAADLMYPHLFYGIVSKYYEKREAKWTEHKHLKRLVEMIATEQSKDVVLKDFLARLDEVVGHG